MAVDVERETQITALLRKPYRMVVRGEPDEGYLAEATELPGCITAGETPAEAMELLRDAMAGWFESAFERGLDIPEPADEAYNGRILVRLPKSLHRQLVEQAKEQGVSLNQWILTLLAMQSGVAAEPQAAPLRTS
jgi:antitoxin HicB